MHAQPRIDHILRPGPHATAADRVVDRVGMVADEGFDFSIADSLGRSACLAALVHRQRRLLQDVAHQLEAANQALHVVAIAQKIRVDQRRRQRVLAGKTQRAPAQGAQQADVTGIAFAIAGRAAMVDDLANDEVQLNIR